MECIRAPCHLLFSPLYGDKFREICAWDGIGIGEVGMCLPVSVLCKVLAARPTRKEGGRWISCRCKGHFSILQHGVESNVPKDSEAGKAFLFEGVFSDSSDRKSKSEARLHKYTLECQMALQTDAYRALFFGKLHLGRAACSGPVADPREAAMQPY